MSHNKDLDTKNAPTEPAESSGVPEKAGIILVTLIVVAAVANLPLAMANVALPAIGTYFNASQTQLNLVAVGYSLGLACSVLWLGALGDRYGRKQMALLGVTLSIPAALICGFAPTIQILIVGRYFWHNHPLHTGSRLYRNGHLDLHRLRW